MNFDGPISNFNNILSEMSQVVYVYFFSSCIQYPSDHKSCTLSLESLMHILINLIP